MNDLLRRLPKTDLHCHLDGSLRPQTALELARRFRVKLPADNLEDLTPFLQVSPTCRSLKEFLDVFELLYPLLRRPEAVERLAYELVEDCAAENIRHVEARFAPELQATASFPTDAVVEAVLKGLKKGRRDFGTAAQAACAEDVASRNAFHHAVIMDYGEILRKIMEAPSVVCW